MDILDIFVIVTAVLASLTKIIDVVTTIKYVGTDRELNPIGRWLFQRMGCTAGCWVCFTFEAIVFTLFAWQAVVNDSLVDKIGCIVIFILFVYGHISAGIFNTTHRATFIVRVFLKLYCRLNRLLT